MRSKIIPLGALMFLSGAAMAADAQLDAARRCTQVKDSLERLVCFDRAFAGAATPAPAPPAARVPAPVPAAAPVAASPSPMVAAPAPAPAPAAAPALGDESLKRKASETEDTGPTSLTARISALKETGKNVYRISLDNGQVWQQMDMESLFIVKAGDVVEVQKGKLGGYRMGKTSGSGWVRVRRVK